jgi:hypothetical protein
VGQYCAHTPNGSVCWPDAVPPTVSGVTVTCAAPCLRDGVLHVEATVADDAEVLGADVSLDLGGPPAAMQRSGGVWTADVNLAALPFNAFEADVVVTVTASDGARNKVSARGAPVHVTRLKWAYDAGAPLSAPAVMQDGTTIVGVSRTSQQVLAVKADGTKKWEATTANRFVTAAPTVGEKAIWVSDDRNVFAIDPVALTTVASVGVAMDGATSGSLATRSEPTEWAFVGSLTGRVGAASMTPLEYTRSGLGDACTTGPVLSSDGTTVFVATRTVTSAANLRSFAFDGALTPRWSAGIGVNVTAPVAVDGSGAIWSASQDAKLVKTVPSDLSGDPVTVATLSGSAIDSPVVLPSGDIVVGDGSGTLHRFSSTGVRRWASEPNLESPVLAPVVVTSAQEVLIVPTQGGRIYAVRSDGSVGWFGQLDATGLRAVNIHPPNSQNGSILSTAVVVGEGGTLYAVIVDGQLDASAPWPKAFHDPRNTNRAGPQP